MYLIHTFYFQHFKSRKKYRENTNYKERHIANTEVTVDLANTSRKRPTRTSSISHQLYTACIHKVSISITRNDFSGKEVGRHVKSVAFIITDAARHGFSKVWFLFPRDEFMRHISAHLVTRLHSRRKKNNFDSYVHRHQTDEKQNQPSDNNFSSVDVSKVTPGYTTLTN